MRDKCQRRRRRIQAAALGRCLTTQAITEPSQLFEEGIPITVTMFDTPRAVKSCFLSDSKATLQVIGLVFTIRSECFDFEVAGYSERETLLQSGVANSALRTWFV